jgi:hypothetical protein
MPSQSSSRLLQVSVPLPPGTHTCGTPPTQLFTVRWQRPAPQVVVPRPSSTMPSQSSSRPLQTSVSGTCSPGQSTPNTPPAHVREPPRQMPTPRVPAGPV